MVCAGDGVRGPMYCTSAVRLDHSDKSILEGFRSVLMFMNVEKNTS